MKAKDIFGEVKELTINKCLTVVVALMLCLSVGCSRSGGANGTGSVEPGKDNSAAGSKSAEQHQPITLKFSGVNDNRQEMMDKIVKPSIEKKFPYITVEYLHATKGVENLIASGEIPDIVIAGHDQIPKLLETDLAADLTPLVKKQNFDLNKIDPVVVGTTKAYSSKAQLNALPFATKTFALFYNKDLFDKFGVPYPKDDMTWEDAIEIAKKVTRTDGGVSYAGLQYSNNNAYFANGIALPMVNPDTNKAAFNSDAGLKVLNTLKNIYSIPGNEFRGQLLEKFLKGEIAMIPWWAGDTFASLQKQADEGGAINWDMVTYPHFAGVDGIIEPAITTFVISKVSKLQDDAFMAAAYLATDPEVQKFSAQFDQLPVVQVPNLPSVFASSFSVVKGKNMAGVLKGKYIAGHIPSQYDSIAENAFNKYSQQYRDGKITDARDALAKAEEEANNKISEAMSK